MNRGTPGQDAPVFVKIEEYQDILDIVNLVKEKINDANKTLDDIHNLRKQEDDELAIWGKTLSDIDKKVGVVDRTLQQPEHLW